MAKLQDPVPPLEFEEEEGTGNGEEQELEVFVKGRDVIPEEESEEDKVPEEYKSLTKKQLVEMLSKAQEESNQAAALQAAVSSLGEKLSKPSSTPHGFEVSPQKKGESDEEYAKRINETLFGDNPYQVLQEVIRREVQPLLHGIQSQTVQQAKQLLERDEEKGPIFKKYKEEIESMVAAMPAEHRNNPGVYEFALNQIQIRHMDEIIQDRVRMELEKAKGDEPQVVVRKPQVSQGQTTRGSLAPKTTRKRVIIDEATAIRLEKQGIDIKDYIRMNGV
jgi:hypothetical protein